MPISLTTNNNIIVRNTSPTGPRVVISGDRSNTTITVASMSPQNITVSNYGAGLQSENPITLRNQLVEIRSIEHIPDVSVVDRTDGAVPLYNANNGLYEIKQIEFNNISGIIDEGEF